MQRYIKIYINIKTFFVVSLQGFAKFNSDVLALL